MPGHCVGPRKARYEKGETHSTLGRYTPQVSRFPINEEGQLKLKSKGVRLGVALVALVAVYGRRLRPVVPAA